MVNIYARREVLLKDIQKIQAKIARLKEECASSVRKLEDEARDKAQRLYLVNKKIKEEKE